MAQRNLVTVGKNKDIPSTTNFLSFVYTRSDTSHASWTNSHCSTGNSNNSSLITILTGKSQLRKLFLSRELTLEINSSENCIYLKRFPMVQG